jgi:hypothetical protein
MGDLVRVLAMHAVEREPREALRGGRLERRRAEGRIAQLEEADASLGPTRKITKEEWRKEFK